MLRKEKKKKGKGYFREYESIWKMGGNNCQFFGFYVKIVIEILTKIVIEILTFGILLPALLNT